MKAYFSAPSGDDGVRISFESENNSDQFLLELLAEKGIVKISEAGEEDEHAFVVVKRFSYANKKGRR